MKRTRQRQRKRERGNYAIWYLWILFPPFFFILYVQKKGICKTNSFECGDEYLIPEVYYFHLCFIFLSSFLFLYKTVYDYITLFFIMRLIQLPKELIKKVAQYLSREYIAQLCLTCKLGYQIFLPILYKHIVLGHRIQIRQLEQGFRRNSYLRQVARQNTQAVTLKCRQGGNDHYWKLIFSQLPKARQLYIRDYMALSVNKIQHILSTLPQVNLLDIQYCELVQSQDEEDNNLTFDHITNLNLMWTDFTVEAIERLFRCVPNLINVNLGANHNRKPLSNDTALQIMQTSCLHIRQLSVSLQQVKETTFCQAVMTWTSTRAIVHSMRRQ